MNMTRLCAVLLAALLATALAGCGDNRSEEQVLIDAGKKIDNLSYRSAIIELRNLLRNNPDSEPARLQLARALTEVGDFDAAEKEVARAGELGAGPDKTLGLLARIYAGRGEFATLLAEVDAGAVSSPELASELAAQRARAKLALGSSAEAVAEFQAILSAGKSTEAQRIALLGLATVAESKADFTDAERLARQSLEVAPDSSESLLRVGQLLIVQQRYEDALTQLAEDAIGAVRFAPLDKFRLYGERAQAHLGLGQLDEAEQAAQAMAQINSQHPMSALLRGQVQYRRGDLDTALETMQAAVAKYPEFPPALVLLGAISMQRDDFEQAEVYLAQATGLAPGNTSARQLLAETRMRMQRPDDAVETLREGLRADEKNPALLSMLGRATMALGEDEQGVAMLREALAAEPDNPQVVLSLASAYVAQGNREDALALLEGLPEGVLDEQQRRILLVVTSYDQDDPSAAQQRLETLLADAPADVTLLNLAGNFFLATDDVARGRDYFEQTLALDPGNRAALLGVMRADDAGGDRSRARELLLAAADADNNDTFAVLALARIEELAGNHAQAIEYVKRAHTLDTSALMPNLSLAAEYLRINDIDAAERHARLAVTAHERVAAAQEAIAVVYLRRNQPEEALVHLKRAVQLDDQNYFYHYNLGVAQTALSQLAQGRDSFQKAFSLNPGHLPSLRSLAVLEVRAGNSQRADQLLRAAREGMGAGPVIDELEGDLRSAQNKHSEAMLAYRRAYDVAPSWPLARKLFVGGQKTGTPDVTSPLRRWLKDNPKHIPARVLLAQTYHRSNDSLKAIEQYEMLIVEQPDSALALNNLAWLYFEQDGSQNRQRALEMASRAHRLAPRNVDVADTLGWIQFNSGQVNAGLETLRAAMASTTPRRSPDIAYHLAAVLHETGASDEARETLLRAMTTTRAFAQREEAQKLLDSL